MNRVDTKGVVGIIAMWVKGGLLLRGKRLLSLVLIGGKLDYANGFREMV
jgi:hypothetical protein